MLQTPHYLNPALGIAVRNTLLPRAEQPLFRLVSIRVRTSGAYIMVISVYAPKLLASVAKSEPVIASYVSWLAQHGCPRLCSAHFSAGPGL